ncbi:hypothetical protein NF27_IE00130 [Candidatus Jidaibacter acanthamoeba]|uniref:Uncharacterized protein n=1 Tax=Candidatus Jidaibacter acanthamoebae TaxID=86105 RepID=A0A0C1MQS3_9RICK|nr:hypothetical protein NF27_IE00130 [Candidatus Jidaibacter acanthamoeba]
MYSKLIIIVPYFSLQDKCSKNECLLDTCKMTLKQYKKALKNLLKKQSKNIVCILAF